MKITSTAQKKTLTFDKPIINRETIGKKPVHHFDQNSEPEEAYVSTKDNPFATGEHSVWASMPSKNPDGSPVMRSVQETLDLAPRSSWKYGGIAGGVGAVIGAGAGALLSGVAGMSPGIGAMVGGAAVGGADSDVAIVHGNLDRTILNHWFCDSYHFKRKTSRRKRL